MLGLGSCIILIPSCQTSSLSMFLPCIHVVVSNYLSWAYQGSEPALVWLAGFIVRECVIFSLHTKVSVDKRESLLVWQIIVNW